MGGASEGVDFARVHTSEMVFFGLAILIPVGGGAALFYFLTRRPKAP